MTSLESSNLAKLVLACFAVLMVAEGTSSEKIYLEGATLSSDKESINGLSTFDTLSTQSESYEYMVMQYREPSKQQYRGWMEDNGIEFISYIPEDAWLISSNLSIEKLKSIDKVERILPYRPKHKIDPTLERKLTRSPSDINVEVILFKSKSHSELSSFYPKSSENGDSDTLNIKISSDRIFELSKHDNVKYIQLEKPAFETKNNDSRNLINVNNFHTLPQNITGKGFTASIRDSGFVGKHPDLNYSGKTIVEDDSEISSHAVHVAGTMLGGGRIDLGSGTPNSLRGVSYGSRLISYDFFFDETELLNELNNSVSKYDSVISQNSWGFAIDPGNRELMGDYTRYSKIYDKAVSGQSAEISDVLSVVFSAGNEGNSHPYTYNTTTGPGATSKNTITVGAVGEDKRLAEFSSRGPTDDGRIKPTLVALGGSARTGAVFSSVPSGQTGYPYAGKFGTSMAAPAVSGTVLLLNQKYNRTYGMTPDPATVKGLLIHTATDLNRTGPDYLTGWGLVNASEAGRYTSNSGSDDLIMRNNLSSLGDQKQYKVKLPSSEEAKFTLVWSDYPASINAGKTLVNDLDLIVKNTSDHRKYPYTLSWENRSEPAKTYKKDSKNVVEQVEVANSSRGIYNIKINASNSIKGSNQDYSLFLPKKSSVNPELKVKSPNKVYYGSTPNFTLSSERKIELAKFSLENRTNNSMRNNSLKLFYNNSFKLDEGSYEVKFWAKKNGLYWNTSEKNFTVDKTRPSLVPINPSNRSFVGPSFELEAISSDNITNVSNTVYEIYNNTTLVEGELNDTVNTSNLSEGDYNISFKAFDLAGNQNTSRIEVKLDKTPPSLNLTNPDKRERVSDNFTIDISANDTLSGLKSTSFSIQNSTINSTIERSGVSDATINSSKLRDGKHQVVVKAKDKAGNEENFTQTIFIDNTPPIISKTNIDDYENLSGTIDIEASFKDASDIDLARFKLNNSSSNNTNWRNFNETVDTKNLNDGDYSLLIEVNDTFGNYKRTAIENITIDNTNPEINLTTYNISTKSKGWINNSKEVQVRCEDSLTGAKNISIGQKSSKSIPGNLTVTGNGNKSREFHCNDFSGNSISSSLRLAIDSKPPMVSDVIPSNRTKDLDRNFAVEISISREENGSGISPSNSSILVNNGEKEITWSNSSVVIKILETDYGDNVKIEGQLRDRLGHKNNIELSYGIRQAPSDETFSGNSGSSTSSDSSGNYQDDNQDTNYSTGRARQENISEKDNSSFNQTVGRLEDNRYDNSKFENKSGSVNFNQNLSNIGPKSNKVSVSVESPQKDIRPPPETSKISRFNMEVNSTNHSSLNITFGINKSRIYRNETEGVSLFRRSETNWESLETRHLGLDNSQYTFASKVRDFSPFMIGINKSKIEEDEFLKGRKNTTYNITAPQGRVSNRSLDLDSWILLPLIVILIAVMVKHKGRIDSPQIEEYKHRAEHTHQDRPN